MTFAFYVFILLSMSRFLKHSSELTNIPKEIHETLPSVTKVED